ncbi:heavy metal-binding domain-containing protein [Mucilaginibacter sabulilitoris]|uniref:Heavy metal-binding domain-containing protein n=1 Tax=Mucilaginibacter sabulilitoris TaxID=1173583 RepID=A0ABZ0TTK2_9SPHI|nr:heavy metal-binding domain-containing protein [Mucilaginibacter sabulilitoris]WPU96434.1 heavy metal-binding domain-containing protein [Mucilaginibacter sabulilitoris]
MKKVTLMAAAILFSGATLFAAGLPVKAVSDTTKTKKVKPVAKPEKVQYTCGMHPDVLSDKPGKCPKCGMELVKKEPAKKKAESMKM